jgi:hypothetical protein
MVPTSQATTTERTILHDVEPVAGILIFHFLNWRGKWKPTVWREFELRYLAVTFRHIGGQRVSSFCKLGRPDLQLANHSVLRYVELRSPKYLWTLGLRALSQASPKTYVFVVKHTYFDFLGIGPVTGIAEKNLKTYIP